MLDLNGESVVTHIRYDVSARSTIRQLRPDWFIDSSRFKKEQLLSWAMSGRDKPKRTIFDKEQANLAIALNNYTSEYKNGFDAVFTEEIKKLRPDWFK